MAGGDFGAHGGDVGFQAACVALLCEDFAAQGFKGGADCAVAADEAGAGECLMFPGLGVFALVFGKGGKAVGEEAAFAVGAQAQVCVV